ncbi:MAG TPA: hypothetical protein ENN29_04890 [Candidatus Hydrogenedentes bacterium]|nr:hypothetical protein [Candidatus Hydrogenedentota bacterium]
MKNNSRIRTVLRWSFRFILVLLLIVIVAFLVVFRGALYNRFFLFPQQQAAWEAIRADRYAVELPYSIPWKHYRGSAHNHSELSHDSVVPFERILEVLQETDRDFIAMSDHCLPGGIADFGAQWRGLYSGKLFIPGYEMSRGFMPWRLDSDVVLDCSKESEALAQEIESLGGLLFIAHPEEDRDWHLPQIRGMEIYNIHADTKDEDLKALAPDILLNFRRYPEQTIRLIFDRNTEMLAHWDTMNVSRKMVGIAANDCHQNIGVYGVYTEDGNLMLHESSGKNAQEYKLNFLTRLLLRLFTGKLVPGEEAFRFQLDPYNLMIRFVSTYALASELTEEAILDAFAAGRVYIGFDMIADSKGFVFMARNKDHQAVMGENIMLTPDTWLIVASPHRCRVTILRHGEKVHQSEGVIVDWQPTVPGKYRVEAELNILGEWTPWVYTNPIEVMRDITTITP